MFTEEDEKYLSAATIARLRELSFAEEEEKAEEMVGSDEVAPAADVAEKVESEAEAPGGGRGEGEGGCGGGGRREGRSAGLGVAHRI